MRNVLALAVLVLVPSVGAQVAGTVTPPEADTTLYLHVINVQDMPINTQAPQDTPATATDDFGFAASSVTCLHPLASSLPQGATAQEFYTYHGYSSPSFVEYDQRSGDGTPRTHPERGLAYDVVVNRSVQPVLRWFMAESNGAGVGDAQQAGLANVVVRATLRAPEAVSIDDKAYDSGELLAEGATLPITATGGRVVGDGASQVTASQVGGRWVYGFTVALDFLADAIPRATGYVLRIDVQVDNPYCEGGKVMPGTARPFADAEHRPRLELRNREPLRAEAHVVVIDGNLTAVWAVRSPWGSYDVAVQEATLRVLGPSDVAPGPPYTIQRYREWAHTLEAVDQGWVLDATAMADGRYTALFSIPNLQHTATVNAEVSFFVHDGELVDQEPDEAPGFGFAMIAGLLAAATVLRRRA